MISKGGNITQALQVTYDLSDTNTRQREIKGLVEACRNFDLVRATMITYDNEDKIEDGGIVISVIPFYKWVNVI